MLDGLSGKMKHKVLFYLVCGIVFLFTLMTIIMLLLCAFNVIRMSSSELIALCVMFFMSFALSFACWSILTVIYDDWKSRRVNRNGRWKH